MSMSIPSGSSPSPFLSIVTPVYKAEGCVKELCRRLKAALGRITEDFEIIMVDDASPDGSWAMVREEANADPRCKGIKLSRNFGQHLAITAGLDAARGEWVVVMDCDLQDQPEEIEKLYRAAISNNVDVVFGRRIHRQDRWLKKMSSKMFYTVYNLLSSSQYDYRVANFSISKRKVVDQFKRLREHNRFFPLFIQWLGFKVSFVDVEHGSRYEGKTSYSFSKLLCFSTNTIVSQSNRPLYVAIILGVTISALSIFSIVYFVLRYFCCGVPVQGWTSLATSIWFLGGLTLATLGVFGVYLGKIFDEVKNRPLYIVDQLDGFHEACSPNQSVSSSNDG